jgi:hypothetical protein
MTPEEAMLVAPLCVGRAAFLAQTIVGVLKTKTYVYLWI